MEYLVGEEFGDFIKKIPDREFDMEKICGIIKDNMPSLVETYGICFIKANTIEPGTGLGAKIERQFSILETNANVETTNKVLTFSMGNGGYVEVVTGIDKNFFWDEKIENDYYIVAKIIFLLLGRARVMKSLDVMRYTDMLTGIPNETQLHRFMVTKVKEGKFWSYCANFMNVRNMKLLNNRYGERGGDRLLIQYAQKIQEFLGEDGCVARFGGDNFFAFVLTEKHEEFLQFMRDLSVDMVAPNGQKQSVKMDTRVGYYCLKSGDQIEQAMNNSNIALRQAKSSSYPDVVVYEEHMKTKMLQLKQLEDNIPSALANREFVVYYQPKADISNEKNYRLCGAEALVRWNKDGRMVPPAQFIPILEENGMVTQIDFYVFEQVCRDLKEWEEKGMQPVRISSNFSRRHLRDMNFADKIRNVIQKYNVNPKYLEIEVTESYEVEDLEALTKFEREMHELGIRLSVDDFGSGFSSLKMVKNIAADTIKIDKSVIDGVGAATIEDDVIASHIIQMLKSLGKEVIAEGVEKEEQAAFLRANGCGRIQGYLFGKPEEKTVFEQRLTVN